MEHKMARPKSNNSFTTLTLRFSGKQKLALEEIQQLALNRGVANSELIRNLIQLGLEVYKLGGTIGFDGKVVLPNISSEIQHQETKEIKKSKFLE
jgi:hypothetical protein